MVARQHRSGRRLRIRWPRVIFAASVLLVSCAFYVVIRLHIDIGALDGVERNMHPRHGSLKTFRSNTTAVSSISSTGSTWAHPSALPSKQQTSSAFNAHDDNAEAYDAEKHAPTTNKPHVIIHIGPSKTATTTIQKECVRLKNQLRSDNYIYIGRYSGATNYSNLHALLQGKCYKLYREDALNKQKLQYAASNDIHDVTSSVPIHFNATPTLVYDPSYVFHSNVACWNKMITLFAKLHQQHKHVIFSDEAYSYKTMWGNNGPYSQPRYFETIQTVLRDWNVTVVVGYRRYAEWLLSALKESNSKIMAGKDITFDGWPHQSGKAPLSVWPIIQHWMSKKMSAGMYNYLDSSVKTWARGGFQPSVLNLHDVNIQDVGYPTQADRNPNLLSQFVCDIIPNAPNTCHFVERVRPHSFSAKENKANGDLAMYSTLVFEAAKLAMIHRNASLGPDTNRTRQDVTKELQIYHQEKLHKTKRDLPLSCPSNEQLEELLLMTKKKEQRFLPAFYASSSQGAQELNTTFWKLVDRLEFCSLDWNRLLHDRPTWSEVLDRLATNDW